LQRDLASTRERGFAMSEQEFESDINAVAAPIRDASGYPIGAIAIVGPAFRLPRERMLSLGREVLAATEAISHEVGLAALTRVTPRQIQPPTKQPSERQTPR
jgi:DNA-binding IclR family transcriptional regulator